MDSVLLTLGGGLLLLPCQGDHGGIIAKTGRFDCDHVPRSSEVTLTLCAPQLRGH